MAPGGPQEAHFKHFGALAAKWPQEAPRTRLKMHTFWPQAIEYGCKNAYFMYKGIAKD